MDVEQKSPWPPPTLGFMHSDVVQLRPTPWPPFRLHSGVDWITSYGGYMHVNGDKILHQELGVVNHCSYNWAVGKFSGVTGFYRQHDRGVLWFLTWNYGKLEYFGEGSLCGAASLHTSWLMQQKPFT
jgi:hypothetical protein